MRDVSWLGPELPPAHPQEPRRAAARWDSQWRREHTTDTVILGSPLDPQLELYQAVSLALRDALD